METNLIPHPDNYYTKPPILYNLPKDEDGIKNKYIPQVNIDVVEDDPNEDDWRKPFLECLTKKLWPDDPKLRLKISK